MIQGITALVDDDFVVVTQKWVFQLDLTGWGWIHIVAGVIAVLTGIGLFSRAMWARTVAAIVSALCINADFWLPYYPWWLVVVIVFDVFVQRPKASDPNGGGHAEATVNG